jgi:ABC-type amino acid transport substrate-binding protein
MKKFVAIFGIIALVIAVTLFSNLYLLKPQTTVQAIVKEESVYDRVMRTGTIRCGYTIYPPDTIKDPNTDKLSGIFVDTMQKAADALHLKLEWTEEVSWGSMIEGLISNRYDAVCSGVWENTDRGRVVGFSRPVFYSALNAYVRKDETRFGNDLTVLNDPNIRIAVSDGETNATVARNRFPRAQQIALPQGSDFSQLLLTVSTGKADVVFIEPAVAADFMKNNPDSLKTLSDRPLLVLPTIVMFKRGQDEFKSMLDSALDQLVNDGEVDDLLKQYEPFPGAFYRDAYAYRAGQ